MILSFLVILFFHIFERITIARDKIVYSYVNIVIDFKSRMN